MRALSDDDGNMVVLTNDELNNDHGENYELNSGATLRGARVSRFGIAPETLTVEEAGLAYHTIVDRYGVQVAAAMATATDDAGTLSDVRRLCSAYLGRSREYGLVDDIFFTGEETGGGQLFALDVANETLYPVPAAGWAAYECVALVDFGDSNKFAMLIGDDREGAPLLLYVGTKSTPSSAGFLEHNGLVGDNLYVWISDDDHASPKLDFVQKLEQ